MSEQGGDEEAADQPAAEQEAAESAEGAAGDPPAVGPRKEPRPKQHEPFVSGGAESTREMREMSRRRREAEEKLQQHLLEAKEKPDED
jgi:hypothetical protein